MKIKKKLRKSTKPILVVAADDAPSMK